MNVGSKYALLIGFPVGILFSAIVLFGSLFPIFDFGLVLIGGRLFWHPLVWAVLIPLVFGASLWFDGKKINENLSKGYSTLKTSFFFILSVNYKVFLTILFVFLLGWIYKLGAGEEVLSILPSTLITLITFVVATFFTTFTLGLVIVSLTRRKLKIDL